jgi:hypothetical protein
MAKKKFDGVVEAVRYKPNGEVDWVRAYERRGATFSDYVLLDRQTLVQRLKSGKRYLAGKRLPYLAGTFEVSSPLRLVNAGGKEILVTDEVQSSQDRLEGVPLI